MKAIYWIIATAAFTIAQPAQAAQTDPEVIIYRFPAVRDDGSPANVGTATVFFCTNFSGADENIRIVMRTGIGTLVSNAVIPMSHLLTAALSTHFVSSYGNASLATGPIAAGTAAIAATSINIICSAMVLDAANAKPVGVALRGIRFNPVPGSQE